jgi:hypothetical protein
LLGGREAGKLVKISSLQASRLKALQHVFMFNAGPYVTDSVASYQAGSAKPAAQFLTRWTAAFPT